MFGKIVIFFGCAIAVAFGDADALYEKGSSLYKTDPSQALELFEQAAEGGNVSAMVGAGHCYETGTGVGVDYAAAIRFYEQAVRQNSLNACEGLGRIYASCPDPEFHDGIKAVKFAGAVARKKPRDFEVQMTMAAAYARNFDFKNAVLTARKASKGVQSIEQAKQMKLDIGKLQSGEPLPGVATEIWMLEAASRDSLWAMKAMVKRYANRADEMYEPARALEMCLRLIDEGDDSYYVAVGDLYFYDEGSFMSLDKAHEYYTKAVKNDCFEDLKKPIRIQYLRSYEFETERLMELAPKMENGYTYTASVPSGTDMYGNTTYTTTTVTVRPNPELAQFYYTLAYKKGAAGAKAHAVRLAGTKIKSANKGLSKYYQEGEKYWKGDGVKKDWPKALELYLKAYADRPNAKTSKSIGDIYLRCRVSRDLAKAEEWMDKTAEHGSCLGYNQLSLFYGCNASENFRNGEKAVYYGKKAVDMAGREAWVLDTLACAYARNGQFDLAIEMQEEACEKAKKSWSGKGLQDFYSRLDLFKQGTAYAYGMKL